MISYSLDLVQNNHLLLLGCYFYSLLYLFFQSVLRFPYSFLKIINLRSKIELKTSNTSKRSEICKISKMELFVKIVNGFQAITIFLKSFFFGLLAVSEMSLNLKVF